MRTSFPTWSRSGIGMADPATDGREGKGAVGGVGGCGLAAGPPPRPRRKQSAHDTGDDQQPTTRRQTLTPDPDHGHTPPHHRPQWTALRTDTDHPGGELGAQHPNHHRHQDASRHARTATDPHRSGQHRPKPTGHSTTSADDAAASIRGRALRCCRAGKPACPRTPWLSSTNTRGNEQAGSRMRGGPCEPEPYSFP